MTLLSCHGLVIDSDLELAGVDAAGTPEPDVAIRLTSDPPPRPTDAAEIIDGVWRAPGYFSFAVPEVADFVVTDGDLVSVVAAHVDVDPRELEVYLLGTALGAILAQRGRLALHANAVQVGDRAVLAVGASGAGKSTLAAQFLTHGHTVLADDVVAVESGSALPGVRRVKLRDDAVARLGLDPRELRPLPGYPDKSEWVFPRADVGPLPIAAVYVLGERGSDRGSRTRTRPARGDEAFAALREHTYRVELAHTAEDRRWWLSAVARLTRSARVVLVDRLAEDGSPSETLAAVLADLEAHAARPSSRSAEPR